MKPDSEKDKRKSIGFFGENIASRFLESRGYGILAKNYQKPWGEVDLIAQKDGIIVFCEVKTNSKRFSGHFSPELRVNPKKYRHIIRTADIFMKNRYPGENMEWRIDIIAVTLDSSTKKARIKHIKNAIF